MVLRTIKYYYFINLKGLPPPEPPLFYFVNASRLRFASHVQHNFNVLLEFKHFHFYSITHKLYFASLIELLLISKISSKFPFHILKFRTKTQKLFVPTVLISNHYYSLPLTIQKLYFASLIESLLISKISSKFPYLV